MSELISINPRAERQRKLRRMLGRALRSAIQGELAGFALVAWDAQGNAHTAYYTDSGPVGQRLMPSFVHDALNQHVAVDLAQRVTSNPIKGD